MEKYLCLIPDEDLVFFQDEVCLWQKVATLERGNHNQTRHINVGTYFAKEFTGRILNFINSKNREFMG
jgi:hypothetical protein